MAVEVRSLTRESVTLSWQMHDDAVGYMVRRIHSLPDGGREDTVRAVVYEGLYCDPGLAPDTEYLFELTSVADPDGPEPAEPVDRQRCRIRTEPPTEFENSRVFFTDFVAPTFRRHQAQYQWCPEWWLHPEAVYAVDEMWHAYEAMRPPAPPAFPSKLRTEWLVVFGWPILDRLTMKNGPMADCHQNDDDAQQADGSVEHHVGPEYGRVRPLPERSAVGQG